MTKMYELYHCLYKGEVVYIGQGLQGRHRHCKSGCSHVFELNKIFFLEGEQLIEVKVLEVSEDNNLIKSMEKEHILLYRPKFNSVYLNKPNSKTSLMNVAKDIRKDLIEYPKTKLGVKHYVHDKKYRELCIEFLDFYLIQDVIDKNIKFYSNAIFKKHGRYKLAQLDKNIRHIKSEVSYHTMFQNALRDLHGIDLEDVSCNMNGKGLI